MHLSSDRLYYFAGENVVQDFNNTTPNPIHPRNSAKDPFAESLNISHISRSVQIRDPEVDREPRKKNASIQRNDLHKEPPRDLGENFVKVLLDEFKRVRQISTKDHKVLLEFWKQNRKSRERESENQMKGRGSVRGDKSFVSQASQTSERLRDLQAIAKEREEDVAHTLEIHSEILKQEENMKKYILDAFRARKAEEQMKNQKPKKMSKETLDRLYKAPPPKEREEKGSQEYDRPFVKRLVELHRDSRPTEKRYQDSETLFKFWQGLSNKQEHKLQKNETNVKEDLELHFDERYDSIQDLFAAKFGYKTYDYRTLATFYKYEVSEADKKRKDIDFDVVALEKPLEKYCLKRRKEHEEFEKKREEEYKKKEEEERARLSKTVIRKEIKATGIEALAKPKDNLIRGKTLLFLKKMFPGDRILQKMLLNEFRKNKLLKYPEEYDIYDSDEEIETYKRNEVGKAFKSMNGQDLREALNKRERDIREPFEKYLEQKYLDNNLKLESEQSQKQREKKEDKQIDRFIAVQVRKYLQLRKRRLYEKIPTLKQFLTQTYNEMHKTHKDATERRFPHITYGYSKRLKKNSYPLDFKRHFFLLVKALSRGKKNPQGNKLLLFWAPPSAGSKAYNCLNTNVSYNKRVNELSRETKIQRLESDFEKTSCWQKDEYYLTRLNLMMRLSDAKECTFTPKVNNKMPKKYKELMQSEYGVWVGQYINESKFNLNEWREAVGDNFLKKFPTIYKYGKFKRALRFWKEEKYIKAYKEIAEAFNIDSIKENFDPTYNPSKFKSVMFSKENLKLGDDEVRKPRENFNDAPNARFLEDVYILLMFLESQEKDLKKSIREVENLLEHDQSKTRSKMFKEKSKTMMCPLGDSCSEDIRPRWPNTNIKTISRFGSKCEFAHHVFELKFKNELQAKKKMLNQTLGELTKKLQGDVDKPPFNPGGAVFTGCIGCGEELRTKGISKGLCSSCQLRKGVSKKLEAYRQKAGQKFLKITSKKSFITQYHEKHEFEERLNLKVGYFRKACVLYENERYKDAFKNIAKAVEMVKNENRNDEEKEQKKSNQLKAQLGIDPSAYLTMDMLYDTAKDGHGADTDRSIESNPGLTRAKIKAYAEKMGYIGEQKVNVNEFLNYQIQEMYVKIEKALQGRVGDIDRLQKKIEKLEGFDEEVEEAHAELNAGMNESLSAKRRKQKSLLPKGKYDIDLVPVEKKIGNLQKTIKYIKHEMEQGQPPQAWKPTRHDNIILEIDKYDRMVAEKLSKPAEGEKSKELGMSSKTEKEKTKSLYTRDLEELMKMPYERSSPTKY